MLITVIKILYAGESTISKGVWHTVAHTYGANGLDQCFLSDFDSCKISQIDYIM